MILATYACGGAADSQASARHAGALAAESEPVSVPTEPGGEISRGDLVAVLDAGIGRFLSGVETEPQVNNGNFVGFRLISVFPDDESLSAMELTPGDVVTRVNGQPIERPEHAFTIWTGLRVASELHIEYQRNGQDRELRYVIVD